MLIVGGITGLAFKRRWAAFVVAGLAMIWTGHIGQFDSNTQGPLPPRGQLVLDYPEVSARHFRVMLERGSGLRTLPYRRGESFEPNLSLAAPAVASRLNEGMDLPVIPPIKPMLAKNVDGIAGVPGDGIIFEPKWDGFRCIVFRDGDELVLGSRNERPLTRYFPEMIDPLKQALPEQCVVDGELIVATNEKLDFDALQQRIHPAESRVNMLAEKTPASFVAFDILALGDEDLRDQAFAQRRKQLEKIGKRFKAPVYLTKTTEDAETAQDWFVRFEGAGLDGLIAKPPDGTYVEDKRVQFKVKHVRTADAVVAGYRIHKDGKGVGSLLLGLYDDDGTLHHVGVAASFTAKRRTEFLDELADYKLEDFSKHPWAAWLEAEAHQDGRMPGAPHRWSGARGGDHSWYPIRPELVAEVKYQSVLNGRFRATTRFLHWRPDRDPASCRYDQLEEPTPVPLSTVLDD